MTSSTSSTSSTVGTSSSFRKAGTSGRSSTARVLGAAACVLSALGALTACTTMQDPADGARPVNVQPVADPSSIDDPGHRNDAQGVAEVTAVLGPALASGNAKRACSLMAVTAQDRVGKAADRDNCVDAVALLSTRLSAVDRRLLTHLQAATVTVTGTTATASLAGGDGSAAVAGIFGTRPTYALSEERWSLG